MNEINIEELDLDDNLLKALQSLPNKQRQCFLLHTIGGYKYREIAGMHKIPEGTVMWRIFQAKKVLKNQIKHPKKYTNYNEGGKQC